MLFSRAFILGLIVVLPIGPVALLIIQRSLQIGSLAGLASGLGAACADACFALITTLGLTTLLPNIDFSRLLVRHIGALFLIIIGLKFIFQKSPTIRTQDEVLTPRYLHHYLWHTFTTFLLTISNPLAIMAFAALFTGSNLIPEEIKKIQYLEITTGVFFGGLSWWCLLVLLAQRIKGLISPQIIHRIFVGLGILLISLGVISVSTRIGTLIDKWH